MNQLENLFALLRENGVKTITIELFPGCVGAPSAKPPAPLEPPKKEIPRVDAAPKEGKIQFIAENTKLEPLPNDPEFKKAEQPKAEQPKAEQPKAEPPKAEPPKAEPPKAEPTKAEPTKAEPTKAEPATEAPKRERKPKKEKPADDSAPTNPDADFAAIDALKQEDVCEAFLKEAAKDDGTPRAKERRTRLIRRMNLDDARRVKDHYELPVDMDQPDMAAIQNEFIEWF